MTTIQRFPGGSGQVFVTTLEVATQAAPNDEDVSATQLPIETAPSSDRQATVIELLWAKTLLEPTGAFVELAAGESGNVLGGIVPGNGQGLDALAGPIEAWQNNRFLVRHHQFFARDDNAGGGVGPITNYGDKLTWLTDSNGRGMIVATNNIATFITSTGFAGVGTFTFRAYIGYRFVKISTTDFLQLVTSQQS